MLIRIRCWGFVSKFFLAKSKALKSCWIGRPYRDIRYKIRMSSRNWCKSTVKSCNQSEDINMQYHIKKLFTFVVLEMKNLLIGFKWGFNEKALSRLSELINFQRNWTKMIYSLQIYLFSFEWMRMVVSK